MSSPLGTQELGLLVAGVSKELDCNGNNILEPLHWARCERWRCVERTHSHKALTEGDRVQRCQGSPFTRTIRPYGLCNPGWLGHTSWRIPITSNPYHCVLLHDHHPESQIYIHHQKFDEIMVHFSGRFYFYTLPGIHRQNLHFT